MAGPQQIFQCQGRVHTRVTAAAAVCFCIAIACTTADTTTTITPVWHYFIVTVNVAVRLQSFAEWQCGSTSSIRSRIGVGMTSIVTAITAATRASTTAIAVILIVA
jgi:hypothetical protein